MPSLYPYRLFISHAWQYHDAYTRMERLLNNAPLFSWKNFSIPMDRRFNNMNKTQLREELRQQIRPVQTLLVLSGIYVSYSDWIQFEIEYAVELNKTIIGVQPRGSSNIPSIVRRYADTTVGWNTGSIINAIRTFT